jgi:hypothetical protein
MERGGWLEEYRVDGLGGELASTLGTRLLGGNNGLDTLLTEDVTTHC